MQYILQNTLLALLEYPDSTLIDVNRMLINKEFRSAVVAKVTDNVVRSFWTEEFANYGDRYTQEATPAIQNKVGQLVSNPLVRNIIGQPKSSFDLRRAMDEKKILICNLSKGKMGDANSTMIGAVLVIRTYLAAMSRAKESLQRQKQLAPCYFYVDEFQNVVNKAFANILSESRKYGLGLIIANQFIAQLNEKDTTAVKDAVFGNVGTTIVFKVGPLDAQELETLFAPTFTPEDMVGLGVGQIYLTLSIDGITSPPFSAQTIPPIDPPEVSFRGRIIHHTRETYGTPREKVEAFIQRRFDDFPITPTKKPERRDGFGPQNGNKQGNGQRVPGRMEHAHSSNSGHTPREVREGDRPFERRAEERPRPPRPTASPAEILRAKQSEKGAIHQPPKEHKEEAKHKNALQEAIRAATVGAQSEAAPPAPKPAPVPKPAPGPKSKAGAPRLEPAPSRNNGEISPEDLRKVLNGDESSIS
jgi:hypothetical protein